MKKQIITIALTAGLIVTSGGWAYSHDMSEGLAKVLVDKNEEIKQKSTEIANLEEAIVEKDKKLEAEQMVIEKQKDQLQKQNDEKKKLDAVNQKLKEEKAKLQSEINFLKQKKGSDVKRQSSMPSRGVVKNQKSIDLVATAYIALCDTGCTGITRTGIDVRNTPSKQIIAVDPSIIPLHSKVKVSLPNGESFYAVAEDTGGDIQGHRIDILMATHSEAVAFGRQTVTVTILN
jgi:3D (Asp-Asp-Asp) domain-containing protein